MIETIHIKNEICKKIQIKAKEYNYDFRTPFKGVTLLIADMWFPDERSEKGLERWEILFDWVQSEYSQKNTIIKNDFTCTLEYKDNVSMSLEVSENIDIQDINSSILQMLDFLAINRWEGIIPDFLPVQQRAVRNKVNETYNAIPIKCLHEAFFDCVERFSEKSALEWMSAENRWENISYASLKESVLRIATLLKNSGITKQDSVAVILPKNENQIIAILGVLSIGAIYVPIGIHQPLERKKKIMESGEIKYVLTDKRYGTDVCQLENIEILMIEDSKNCKPMRSEEIVKDKDAIAYIIFTSGTTGVPKGVMITHKAAYNTIYDINKKFSVDNTDCAIALSELDFDLSVYDVFGMLGWGASLIVLNEENKREPAIWKRILCEKHVTVWNSVPALFEMFLFTVGEQYNRVSLKNIFLSGDWIKLELYSKVRELWPMCNFVSLGGATEAAIWSVYYVVKKLDSEWTSIPYGRPLANQLLRVVNDKGNDAPVGVPGELWIGGYGVAKGYVNQEKLTNEKFNEILGVRWYKTGDKAQYFSDGNIQFLGRLDDQVKVNGYRIELGEIENIIKKESYIDDAVAMIAEHNGKREIIAAVLPQFYKENTEFEMITNEENPEYLQMQKDRIIAVAGFILEVQGNDVTSMEVGNKVETKVVDNVGDYWNAWMLGNNIISLNQDKNYALSSDIKNISNNTLFLELKNNVPMVKKFINNNSTAEELLKDDLFSPEKLLAQGTDSLEFFERVVKKISANAHVAILGSRTGVAVEKMLNFGLCSNIKLVLFDDSLGMLKLSEERLKQYNTPFEYYHFENGLVEEKYIGVFDFVIAVGTMHRYKNPLNGLNAANLLLKSDGELFMLEYENLDPMAVISSAIIENGFSGYNRKRNNTALLTVDEWIENFKKTCYQKVIIEKFPSSSALFISAFSNHHIVQAFQKKFDKYLKESLVHYMIPQEKFSFAWFPLSANGKVDRKAIRQIVTNRKQVKTKNETKNETYVGYEEELANIWKNMLNLEHIGRKEGFFEIGGDSLLATRLIEAVKHKYGIEISLREVFDNSELCKLAGIIEEKVMEIEQMVEGEI